MTSILTNNGAMVALQTLKSINNDLEATQNEISTGKDIATAKDNSAIWAISKVMESDVQGFKAISQSLSLGESTVSVARGTAESVTDSLKLIKEEIVAAQDGTVNRATLKERVDALTAQIQSNVDASQLNGVNLVNGSATQVLKDSDNKDIVINDDANGDGTANDPLYATGMSVISSLDRSGSGVTASKINVEAIDLSTTALKGMGVATYDADGVVTTDATELSLSELSFDTDEDVASALNAIEDMINQASDAAASFGSVQSRMESQNKFVSNLGDALKSGIGSLVDADMEEASARLKALQTQQQLGVQALSIANQAPGAIMSLFR